MKALIDKLASGNAVYETPDAEISENRIAVELEQRQMCIRDRVSTE